MQNLEDIVYESTNAVYPLYLVTDWNIVWATLGAGVLSAVATVLAVVWTHRATTKRFESEQEAQRKSDMLVIVEPNVVTCTFTQLLDSLMMRNKWNRVLLLSGKDGFDFFDNVNKSNKFIYKILNISNNSNVDIISVLISTTSILTDDSESITEYTTENFIKRLRSNEDIVVRLLSEEQGNKIHESSSKRISNKLTFKCTIKYLTLANQQVRYEYHVLIKDYRIIIVEKDESTVTDDASKIEKEATIFRNLQDYTTFDRATYLWSKQAAFQAAMSQQPLPQNYSMNPTQDSQKNSNKSERYENENEVKI